MSEKYSEGSPAEKENHLNYLSDFVEISRNLNSDIQTKIDNEMKRPYTPGVINQPEVSIDLFLRGVTDKVLAGADVSEINFEDVFEKFILAYRSGFQTEAGYLWNLMSQMGTTETDLEIISEKIADYEKTGRPLKAKEILNSLSSANN